MRGLANITVLLSGMLWAAAALAGGGGECPGGLCGTPNQSGGAGAAPCVAGICTGGCGSVLVAMTDRGDTYQFADDFDGDGIEDEFDNCPFAVNYEQVDMDADGIGDGCDVCLTTPDPFQVDVDGDQVGDLCDADLDGDNVVNGVDSCERLYNPSQTNTDGDLEGDQCDLDDDNDGLPDVDDPCRLLAGMTAAMGCDDDVDGDGIAGTIDNCESVFNPELGVDGLQLDADGDSWGDACDLDKDGDGIANFTDNCVGVGNPSQIDLDHDGLGDAGDWAGGAESCDAQECYVVGGDSTNCLDPSAAFSIYLALVGQRVAGHFNVGDEITVALFSNRLGRLHQWTTRLTELPGDSEVSLANGKGAAATLEPSPQVAACVNQGTDGSCEELNTIRFTPDVAGRYAIKVTATLPQGDAFGVATASYTIVAEVEGSAGEGGCAATPVAGLAALTLVLALVRRRR